MTADTLKRARAVLGVTQDDLANLANVKGGARTVRKWESGERAVPGPVAVLLHWMVDGKNPWVQAAHRKHRVIRRSVDTL